MNPEDVFSSSQLYKTPLIRQPTRQELRKIMDKYRLHYSEADIDGYYNTVTKVLSSFQPLNEFPEPSLPVKYPRTPGYRPSQEENRYNAWYWKCNIQGAPSGKLAGKKIVLKDNIAVAGIPMMNGSKMLEGYIPEFDASIVTKILDAGGCIVGKAACEDLCLSGHSFSAATGPILNSHNCHYSAGGSSSGCAVLVCTEVDMAIGGDQGGSIRAPCSWNGLVGLKPTFGLVSYTGAVTYETTIDHLGPMTKTVYDAALLLEVIAGNDGYDHRQKDGIIVPEYTKQLSTDLSDINIGIVNEGFTKSDREIASLVRNAALKLKTFGAIIEDVSIPMHEKGLSLLMPLGFLGGAKTLRSSDFRTIGFGYSETSMQQALFKGFQTHLNDVSPTVKALLLIGDYVEQNYGNYLCSKSQNLKRVVRQAYDDALKKFDVLIMPTVGRQHLLPTSPTNSLSVDDYLNLAWDLLSWNTETFNHTGHPSLTVNCGYLANPRLPVGLMIVGRHFEDGLVLKVGHAVESLG